MLRLINQILEFRKLQNNKLTLSLEEDDIIDFSFDIFNDFKESASSKNISYKFNTVIAHINIYFDKQHIDKIINNPISNALKFTSDNGQIELDISYYNDKTL